MKANTKMRLCKGRNSFLSELELGRYPLEKEEVRRDPKGEKIKRRMNVSRVC